MNTDKTNTINDPFASDPTVRGSANFCYTIRMFKLSTSNNYVFRGSNGVSSFLTTLMLQGQTLPELDGYATSHEVKKLLDDCLYKRITYRQAGKFGYYLDQSDFAEFIQEIQGAPTRIRVVVFNKVTAAGNAGHVETSPLGVDDFPRERDLKVGRALLEVDKIFEREYSRSKLKELERAARENKTIVDPSSVKPPSPELARTQVHVHEHRVDPTDPKSPKFYHLQSVPGVDTQYVLTDMDSEGYSRDGETYQAKREHLPIDSLQRRVSYSPGTDQHKSSYFVPESGLEKLVWEFNIKYCLVQLMMHRLDGTIEELTDSGKTEDWALEDMIPDQEQAYSRYLEGRKALHEELKAAREKSTPKPVA